MSTEPAEPAISAAEFHRQIAAELFDHVLNLLQRTDRTCAENDRLVHAAHASRFHYEFSGSPLNIGLGEWLCARCHTALRQVDSALYHAWRYLETAESYGLGPFHLANAHAALSEAFSLKDNTEAAHHLDLARELATHVTEPEEQKLLATEIAALEKPRT